MIINLIGVFLGLLFTYIAMYLSSLGAGQTLMGYVDLMCFLISFGVPYGCTLAAFGKPIPDLNGMKLMNKLFMPVSWAGTLIGWVMLFYATGVGEYETMFRKFGPYIGITLLTLLYGLIFKVIFTSLIASKK